MKENFSKGDVIRTTPKDGYWGIAVVLSEREKTTEFLPMCHIAITAAVFKYQVEFSELNFDDLKPLEFNRFYRHIPNKTFSKIETLIGVYPRKNRAKLAVIGNIDPSKIYTGPLPFSPDYGLEVKWPLCGYVSSSLGSEAVIQFERSNT